MIILIGVCTSTCANVARKSGDQFVFTKMYLLYLMQIADVRFELYVAPGTPNVPVYYNRKEAEDFVHYSFMSFNATTPDPMVFDIPAACTKL